MTATNLVTLHQGETVTTSVALAEGTHNAHKSVIQLIRQYVADLQEFGEIAFQMRLNPQGKPTEYAWLNEPQATLLMTYMRNNEIVRAFKRALVRAFYEMATQLREQGSWGAQERPPMAKVDPALLREYRLINPGTAQAYLVEMGVTPAHVVNLLARVPAWVNQSGATPPAPIGHVRAAVALYATQEDKTAWYVLPDAFGRLCGEFSARETARMLRDLGFLRSDLGRLTAKAPRRLFPARPNLFVVLKSLNNETGGSHG